MAIREDLPPGAPCWVDLFSADADASAAFYGALFGWTLERGGPEYGGYATFSKDGEPVGGLMQSPADHAVSNFWTVYLAVADAAATVRATRANGGEVFLDAMEVGTLGTMAVVCDPGGAAIGVWQRGEHRGGLVATEGAPCHFELHTRAYDKAVEFYEQVFGWVTEPASDTPGFRYALLGIGDGENAGIMDASGFLPEDVPAHWSVYFAVADVDAALARIGELGGATVMPAEDTPYGRLAVASDVTGAVFKLRGEVRARR